MAKQHPRPKSKAQGGDGSPEPSASRAAHPAAPGQAAAGARAAAAQPSSLPQRRSTYFEAVALYERAIDAMQHHDYQTALDQLQGVLRQYPEEKELHERVKLYINVCERHVAPKDAAPVSVDDRLFAATLALNGGRYDEALSHLRLVRDEDPDNDHALYMLAVAHAQRDEHAQAVAHLERAIALNPENRALARRDPDLEPLHDDEAFHAALEAPAASPQDSTSSRAGDKRRPFRPKSAR
jgi:tetratricopeptide (TPR) repeat protein